MKTTLVSKLAGASLLALSLTALPAAAQTTPVDPATPSDPAVPVEPGVVDTDDYEAEDNDASWGWLGLLGLAGLAGLRRRDHETVRYRSDDVATTTTTDPRY